MPNIPTSFPFSFSVRFLKFSIVDLYSPLTSLILVPSSGLSKTPRIVSAVLLPLLGVSWDGPKLRVRSVDWVDPPSQVISRWVSGGGAWDRVNVS